MNTKLIVLLGGIGAAHLVVGGLVLTGGCAQEDPPMPPGIYVPKQGPAQPENGNSPAYQQPTSATDPAPAPAPAQATTSDPVQDEPIAVPAEQKPEKEAKPAEGHHGDNLYIVVKNDSLWLIAQKNGLTIEELASYNNLSPRAKLKIGQKLYIPAAGKKAIKNKPRGKAKAKAAPSGKKNKKGVKPAGKGKSKAKADGKLPADGIYIVKAGDNFSFIAKRYGIKVSDIEAANPGVDSKRLHVGQKLRLSANAAPVTKKSAAKSAKKAPKKKAAAAKPAKKTETAPAAANNDQPAPTEKKLDEPAEKKSEPAASETDSLLNTVKPAGENKTTDDKAQDAPAPDSVKAVVPDAKNPMAVVPDEDQVITGQNSKTTVIIGSDTTLAAFCKKFLVSPEVVRQRNASIPENGHLKKGMRISLIGDDDSAI